MKYRPTWINKSWGRLNGFKGKTKRYSVDYDSERDNRLVKIEGELDREDLISLVYELELIMAKNNQFFPLVCKRILREGASGWVRGKSNAILRAKQ